VSGPFVVSGDRITFSVGDEERGVLRSVPALLDIGGDADGRLDYTPHPDDEDAATKYRDLVGDDLAQMRRVDRAAFEKVLDGESGPPETIEAFMRVIGEARIVLAGRLGIEDDGWESEMDMRSDPELALLGWLGYLQDAAVETLTELF
jgi:hypothetical protein